MILAWRTRIGLLVADVLLFVLATSPAATTSTPAP
jgi:hypothetical protein